MSTNSTTVDPDVKPDGGLGNRNDTNLRAAFPGTPTYNEYTSTAVRNAGIAGLQGNGGPGDSIVGSSNGIVNDSGYMFGTFDLNYQGTTDDPVPDIAGNTSTVEGKPFAGGGGAPTSPYVPPLTSPGEGNGVSDTSQPAWTGHAPSPDVSFGSGNGHLSNPGGATSTSTATSLQEMKNLSLGSSS
jgi:hypothetical protein